jgi:hypothetical protein
MRKTVYVIYAWCLSRIIYDPDVAFYLQLFVYLWELQHFFHHDQNTCLHWKSFTLEKHLRHVTIDLESKDEHSSEYTIPKEVLVTWIHFMIQIICNYAYNCGRIGMHKANECKGINFNYRKTYNAKANNDNDNWNETPIQKSNNKSYKKTNVINYLVMRKVLRKQ